MTRDEIYKACTKWIVEAGDDHEWNRETVTDFALAMVRKHNAELVKSLDEETDMDSAWVEGFVNDKCP